jgi:uncharacterized protein (DUF58 family)
VSWRRTPTPAPAPAANEVIRDAAALRGLELKVTRRLDGLLSGDYHGLVPGPGSEPAEGRVYVPGDDVRRIDWNLTARTLEPHVRDTDADRELETWLVIDGSASLDFGTANCEKRDLAVAAAAAIGFLTARGGNRLGAVITGGESLIHVPARSGRKAVTALLHKLASRPRADGPPAEGPTLADGLGLASRLHRRRGALVAVSDFLDTGWERPLRFAGARHQTLACVIGDPRERELPPVGLLTLVDPESGRLVEVQTASGKLRERYRAAAAEQRERIDTALRASGASVLNLSTDRDWIRDVVQFVVSGRRRQSALTKAVRL